MRRALDVVATVATLAAAGYAVARVVADGRARARAPRPRVLSWLEATEAMESPALRAALRRAAVEIRRDSARGGDL